MMKNKYVMDRSNAQYKDSIMRQFNQDYPTYIVSTHKIQQTLFNLHFLL